jgi:hypothetical protein
MKHLMAASLSLFLVPMAVRAEEGENPFRKAMVGDYIAYKVTTKVMDENIEVTLKQIVSRKDEKELTLKAIATFAGEEVPSKDMKIDLTKPYDRIRAAMQSDKNGKFEKTGEGKETITAGGKTYECTWIGGKVTTDVGGMKVNSQVKLWFSTSVPLTGLVKMEMKSTAAAVVMEMTGSGKGK